MPMGNIILSPETALFAFKKYLKFRKWTALGVIAGVVFGQWNSLIGIMGIILEYNF